MRQSCRSPTRVIRPERGCGNRTSSTLIRRSRITTSKFAMNLHHHPAPLSQKGESATVELNVAPRLGEIGVGSAPQDACGLVLPFVIQKQFPVSPSIDSQQFVPAPAAVWVFSAGDQRFSVVDMVVAAWFRGDFQALWQEFRSGADGEQLAAEEGLEPESEVLQALSDKFRAEQDLITAEETEGWLGARGLTLSDFNDYFHRQYWRQHTTTPSPQTDVNYPNASPDDQQLFMKDVLFSNKFDDLARRLCWPVTVSVGIDHPATPSTDKLEAERTRFFQRTGLQAEQLSECLGLIGRDRAWFETQVELEAGYRGYCERIFTPANRARTLAALRLPLTRFEVEIMDLESEDAVREAVLCLAADGLSMEELAEQEGYVIEERQLLLEEFSEEVQQRFLSSETGRVIQLIDSDNRFQLCRVISKREPTLADEKVLKRVDAELLASHFGNLVSKHIVWLIERDPPV